MGELVPRSRGARHRGSWHLRRPGVSGAFARYVYEPSPRSCSQNLTVHLVAPSWACDACAKSVEVAGVPAPAAPQSEGTFYRSGLPPSAAQDGRPIYEAADGRYLYYWSAFGAWRVGSDYASESAWVVSRSGELAWCPTGAREWYPVVGISLAFSPVFGNFGQRQLVLTRVWET